MISKEKFFRFIQTLKRKAETEKYMKNENICLTAYLSFVLFTQKAQIK